MINFQITSTYQFFIENFHGLIPQEQALNHNIPKRFFILMHGRSGSSLLVSLLDSHPKIKCSSEIFYKQPTRYPYKLISGLERYYRYRRGSDIAWGFKAKLEQIEKCGVTHEEFFDYLIERNTTIISLIRDNIFRSAISVLIAGKRGNIFHNSSEKISNYAPVNLNPKQVLAVMKQRQFQKEKIQTLISRLPVDVLQLKYEEHLSDIHRHNSTCSLIFNALDIESVPVTSSFKKMTNNKLSDSVINAEEVVNFIAASQFYEYVANVII
ncbi:hypothetical protein BJP36_32435 [Moorena producens JHB]|uniref:Sulfotransferase n=1 Tax=Moorena producens (strain JHB) TaxID=1454205 RepID=A0A1D9G8L0_MOOP1|nr:hypothetical protein [Moorena producens]AOY83933.1 hypothetical protein BJP36_32435 [Moorena producens JHB]